MRAGLGFMSQSIAHAVLPLESKQGSTKGIWYQKGVHPIIYRNSLPLKLTNGIYSWVASRDTEYARTAEFSLLKSQISHSNKPHSYLNSKNCVLQIYIQADTVFLTNYTYMAYLSQQKRHLWDRNK